MLALTFEAFLCGGVGEAISHGGRCAEEGEHKIGLVEVAEVSEAKTTMIC